jgi:hypothetical protein
MRVSQSILYADVCMLADFVGEVVSSMVGDGIVALLFPGISKPQPSPREGEWNASLGSLAAFLAGIAALFCGLATFGVLRGISDVLLWLCWAAQCWWRSSPRSSLTVHWK